MSDIIQFKIPELAHMKKVPEKLFFKGNLELLKRKKIGIVGSRRPSSYTKIFTSKLASSLSSCNICIVSGAAMGVDAISHKSAGASNTIAVVANGLDIKYPKINKNLIEDIEKNGLVLSQFEDGYSARPYSFVLRNELVVALSDIIIITQADLNSGSLHSAKFAIEQGKEIYVLPQRINESLGTNELIEKGLATPIYNIDKFILKFTNNEKMNLDYFLEFCKDNPTYSEALEKYPNETFENELNGKIKIIDGYVTIN